MRLWSASLGGSKGRPIDKSNRRRERVSEMARGDGQGGTPPEETRNDRQTPAVLRDPSVGALTAVMVQR